MGALICLKDPIKQKKKGANEHDIKEAMKEVTGGERVDKNPLIDFKCKESLSIVL